MMNFEILLQTNIKATYELRIHKTFLIQIV